MSTLNQEKLCLQKGTNIFQKISFPQSEKFFKMKKIEESLKVNCCR